jgi:hypothetical protein
MLQPSTPSIEMRSPGAQRGLSGLGIVAVTAPQQYIDGGGAYILGPVPGLPGGGPPNVVEPAQTLPIGPNQGGTNPVYYDNSGNVITSAVCGTIYNFTVPGYEGQTLHIVQTKNGASSFTGPMQMPVLNYASKCNQDEGAYTVQAFTQSGQLLGSTNFNVLASPASPTGGAGPLSPAGLPGLPAATGQPAPGPGTTSSTSALPAGSATTPLTTAAAAAPTGLAALSTTDWLIIAVLTVLIIEQSGKR